MNSLLPLQIRDSYRLSLPEGLKDLMSDISREVLRVQPQSLYQFIANYLEALLQARQALTIACQICNESCECTCDVELDAELREAGLSDEDVSVAVNLIMDHFKNESVKERNLFVTLLEKTSIEEDQMFAVQEAIQKAFKRKLLKNTVEMQSESNDAIIAAQHTIQLYQSISKIEDVFVQKQYKPDEDSNSTISLPGSHAIQHVGFTEVLNSLLPSENKVDDEEYINNDYIEDNCNYTVTEKEDNGSNEVENIESINPEHTNIDAIFEDFDNKKEEIMEEIERNEVESIISSVEESILSDNYDF